MRATGVPTQNWTTSPYLCPAPPPSLGPRPATPRPRPSLPWGLGGGSLTSEDGLLTLTVPSGALGATDLAFFSIQMVQNKMPGGLGLAYRVTARDGNGSEPNLLRPLELTFTLPGNMVDGLAPEDLLLAYHGTDGRWQASSERQTEVMAMAGGGMRLKGTFQKSGDYTVVPRYQLHPAQSTLKINAELLLTALKLTPTTVVGAYGSFSMVEYSRVPATAWAVNGVAGGDSNVGRILPVDQPSQRRYFAPGRKPSTNPVKVTAQIADGGRNVTVASRIRIEESKGWLEADQIVYYNQQSNRDGVRRSLEVEGQARYAFDLMEKYLTSPTRENDGGGSFTAKLRPGGWATLRIVYSEEVYRPCECEEVNERRSTQYTFTAAEDVRALPQELVYLSAVVRPSGAYTLSGLVGVQVEGDYSYSFTESSRCEGRPVRPAINRSGKDTASFLSLDDSPFSMEGVVKPEGPDRMKGSTSQYGTLIMPKKELTFNNKKGAFIPSWFLPYEPDDLVRPKRQEGLLESGPDLQQDKLAQLKGSLTAARGEDQPVVDMLANHEPRIRLVACKTPEAPSVRRQSRPEGAP